jgi:predicted nucleotidyltransferase
MTTVIDPHRAEVQRLCRQFGVQQLDVFGSAAGEAFDPARSDVDLVVDFGPGEQADLFNRHVGLKDSPERLLDRNVDLVVTGAMQNPHFIESVNRTRQPVCAHTLAETA